MGRRKFSFAAANYSLVVVSSGGFANASSSSRLNRLSTFSLSLYALHVKNKIAGDTL
jgi:hypothetical protein